MSIASEVANALLDMGYTDVLPSSSKGLYAAEKIFHGAGFIQLQGKYTFYAKNIDNQQFIDDCKKVYEEIYQKSKVA